MALRFFWTCESETLGAEDYSVGDTTATATGGIAVGTTGVKVGTNGLYTTDGTDYYSFDTTTPIAVIDEGALGFWIKIVGSMPGINGDIGIQLTGVSSTANAIKTRINATVASLWTYDSGGASQSVTASGTSLSADTWYFVVARWDFPNDKLKIEVYTGTSETAIQEAENTSATGTPPSELVLSTGLRVGNISSVTSVMYLDNIFIADTYDEPLHLYGNRDITDVADYATSAPVTTQFFQYETRVNTLLRM